MDIWRSFTSNLEFLVCLGRVIVNHGRGEGGRGWRGGGAVLDLVEEKRVHNTQPKYSFLAYEKSYTFREDMSARFLNAIKTDFEL